VRVRDNIPDRYHLGLTSCGFRKLAVARDPACLVAFYREVPFRYPPLFEALCLTYFWADPVVGEVQFAANPAGDDLQGLAVSVRYDPLLWDYLVKNGYLILGRMSGGRYDPCAFDTARRKGRDAPVVRVDHKEILSFNRLGRPSALAKSFSGFLDGTLS